MPEETPANPVAAVNVLDLFERDDIENFTPEEVRAIVAYQRDKRAQFVALEAEGKSVRAKKKPPAPAVEDILSKPVGEVK